MKKTIPNVYPNPTQGEIALEGEGISHVRIANLYGQTDSLLFSFILFYSLLFFSHGNDTTLSYTGSGKNILVCWFFSVIIQRRKILRLYNRMKPNRNSFLNPRIWHLCKGIVKNALHTWRIFVRWDIYKELTFPFSSFVSA